MDARLRARVIEEWRGLPEEAFPRDTSQAVGVILAKVMKDLGLAGRLREEEILAGWKEVVGEFLAQHSAPTKLIEGVLQVRVLQPAMLYELERTWRREIVRKLKERFGKTIRDVRFRVG